MGLRINTNLPALTAQRAIDINVRNTEKAMEQLASGNRYVHASDGASDFAIGENLRAQKSGMEAAERNSEAATNYVQIAEGGLNEQNNILIRMRELSVQAASDTNTDSEREMMNYEFQQLGKEFDRISQSTSYGKQKLLNGDGKSMQIQVGPNNSEYDSIKLDMGLNSTASAMGIDGLDISDRSGASDSLKSIDDALTSMGQQRASLAGIQSRFNSVTNFTSDEVTGLESARSRYEDTDVAKSYSEMAKGTALQQYQMAVLSEANRWPGNILKLIG